MKIIISEIQYQQIFNKDILNINEQKVDGISGAAIATSNQYVYPGWRWTNDPPEKISLTINPNNKLDFCRPQGFITFGYPGPDWDWCKAKPTGDSYMGTTIYVYKGYEVGVQDLTNSWESPKEYLKDEDFFQNVITTNPPSEIKIINDAIRTYNSTSTTWKKLSRLGNWDGKVYNLLSISSDKKSLEEAFLSSYTSEGIGIDNTNLLYPKPLIEEFFKLKDVTERDLFTVLNQERFKKLQIENLKKYQEDTKKWGKAYNLWYDKFGSKYGEIQQSINNLETSKMLQIYVDAENVRILQDQDNTRVDRSYLNLPIDNYSTEYGNNDFTFQSDVETQPTVVDWDNMISDLRKKVQEIDIPRKLTKKENIKKFQDWLDKNYPNQWTSNGQPLNKKVPGYGTFGPQTTKAWTLYGPIYYYASKGFVKPPPPKPTPPESRVLADRKVGELSNLEQIIDTYLHIIESSTSHNERFESQSASKYKEFCTKPVATSKEPGKGDMTMYRGMYGGGGGNYKHTFNYVCDTKQLGGVWWYSAGKNVGSCGCVHNPNTPVVFDKVWRYNMSEIVEYGATQIDTRGAWEKVTDWADDCFGDWHCIADIASIAVLFIPVPGLNVALSAAIDLASGVGYVVEGEEGWQLNAGLTLLGAAFSGIEALKFTNKALSGGYKGAKWYTALNKTVKEVGDKEFINSIKGMSKAEASAVWKNKVGEIVKDLTSSEIKMLEDALTAFKSPQFQKLMKEGGELNDLLVQMSKLTPKEKEILQIITNPKNIKGNKLKEFADMMKKEGFDLQKTLRGFMPRFANKEALIQAGLFAGVQVYGEDIGKKLKEVIDTIKKFTGQNIDPEKLMNQVDKNPNDVSSMELKKSLEDVGSSYFLYNMINIEGKAIAKLLSKYDIDVNKNIRDIVFNGMDSVTGKLILTNATDWLKEIWDNEKKMVSENKTKEEIKQYISEEYNKIIDLLEKAPEEDRLQSIFDNLEKEEKENEKLEPADYENLKEFFPELF